MTSLWQLTGPKVASDDFAGGSFDTAVIGAGITGLTTAVLLARSGQRVVVLEGREVGAATTGNSTAKLSLLQGTVLSQIREHSGDEALQAYVEANREGQAWLLRWLETRGIEVERRPAFTYAEGPEHRKDLEREREATQHAGLPVQETELDAGTARLPFATFGALMLAEQAQLQPMVVLDELARELRELGGTLITRCPVRDIDIERNRVSISTDLGSFAADRCVLATGTPILDRGLFFAKHEPGRSYAIAYRVRPEEQISAMYVGIGQSARSLRTATHRSADDVLVVGGGSHVTGREHDTLGRLSEIDDWTAAMFGAREGVAWWGAQDYRTHSRLPFAGGLPRGGGRVYAATGYNKWGFTNGVAAALALSSEILGGNIAWAKTLKEHALKPAAVKDALAANAEVAANLVTDWLGVELRSAKGSQEQDPHEGEGRVVREGAHPVAVSRVDGRVCRLSAVCTHLGGVLSWNNAEQTWDCPLHGSRFSHDGKRLEGPAIRDLSEKENSGPAHRDGM